MNKNICTLNGTWNLTFTLNDKKYTAAACVPGNVEPSLQALGLCGDYMPADNERSMIKFETVDDWTYTTVFDAPELPDGYTRNLVFEGIDTLAEIYLNGEKLGNTENMHMTYKYPVNLRPFGNELTVIIRSVDLWARNHPHDQFSRPQNFLGEYDTQTNMRKTRHQWGWDNAPHLITAGIFRPVYIENLPPKRFEDIYLFTEEIREDIAVIGISYFYKTPVKDLSDHRIRISLIDGETVVHSSTFPINFVQGLAKIGVDRNKIQLWWPSGFGDPKLYDIKIEMLEDGESVAVYERKFGIRTIHIDHTDDITEDGKGDFIFKVNGEKVFLRGTSWKPLDPLASEADRKTKTLDALREIPKLHCNMVRIWGGGIYEDKEFFDFCDANGIMVWQDFMFACEIPSTEEDYCKLASEEAVQIIKKLRNHPSLALWCGDNECDRCIEWVMPRSNMIPSQSVITRRVLKDAVILNDPYRYYLLSSPICSDEFHLSRHTNGNPRNERTFRVMTDHGYIYPSEIHFYVTPDKYSDSLRETKSRILGETGPIQLCAIAANDVTFEREKARMERLWNSPQIWSNGKHQNDGYFTVWRNTGSMVCKHFFGRDFTFDEWKEYRLAVNVVCAEVFKDALEYSRAVRWEKTGVIWWSLCDMWPMAFNYSVMDYELGPKLPYFWIEKSQQEFLLAAVNTEVGGEISLYALNDTLEKRKVKYSVKAYDQNGNCETIATGNITQEKNSSSLVQRISNPEQSELWIITWSDGVREYKNHAFTGKASWDVMKKWVDIIADEFGIADKILELK
ncbi:MAG: hypothetical protein E7633_04290 [Ruminococcaceae bacterium]|nr:hypothetical protein [Oscillospiraceae bacterium]